MSISTISSREFNQDIGRAKRAAADGPVFITDRGKPAHVLLSITEYQSLTNEQASIVDLLSMPVSDVIDFEPEKLGGEMFKPADPS